MGIFDALFNPSKNTNKGYSQAFSNLNQTQAQTNPFLSGLVDSGEQGNSYLADLLGYGPNADSVAEGLMNNPGYQAQLKQGIEAVDASASARGMLQSGDNQKAVNDYGQNSYFNFRQNEIGNAQGVVNNGLQGVNGLNNNANQYNQLAVGQGNAKDAGNAGAFGNILGIGSTLLGLGTGLPKTGGSSIGRIGQPTRLPGY
jgi:hypothetical protein